MPVFVRIGGHPSVDVQHVQVLDDDSLELDLYNDGDTHLQPHFRGVVRGNGELVRVAGADARFLMPGMVRGLNVPVDIELMPGAYEIAGVLELGEGRVIPVHHDFVVLDERIGAITAVD